jgi:hypothetical protein
MVFSNRLSSGGGYDINDLVYVIIIIILSNKIKDSYKFLPFVIKLIF